MGRAGLEPATLGLKVPCRDHQRWGARCGPRLSRGVLARRAGGPRRVSGLRVRGGSARRRRRSPAISTSRRSPATPRIAHCVEKGAAIDVEQLRVVRGGTLALDGVSLQVSAGRGHGLARPERQRQVDVDPGRRRRAADHVGRRHGVRRSRRLGVAPRADRLRPPSAIPATRHGGAGGNPGEAGANRPRRRYRGGCDERAAATDDRLRRRRRRRRLGGRTHPPGPGCNQPGRNPTRRRAKT